MHVPSFQKLLYAGSRLALVTTLALPLSVVAIDTADADEPTRPLTRLDTDRSGTISLEEYLSKTTAHLERRFDRRDKNDDETISEDEYPSPSSNPDREALLSCIESALGHSVGRPTWEEYLEVADLNFDEVVDFDEFMSLGVDRKTEHFNNIDADDNGEITRDELRQARIQGRQKKRERRAAIRACRQQVSES